MGPIQRNLFLNSKIIRSLFSDLKVVGFTRSMKAGTLCSDARGLGKSA